MPTCSPDFPHVASINFVRATLNVSLSLAYVQDSEVAEWAALYLNKHAYMPIITHRSSKMSHIGHLIKKISCLFFFRIKQNEERLHTKQTAKSPYPSTFVHRLHCSARLAEPRRGSNDVFDKTGGMGLRGETCSFPPRWRVNETPVKARGSYLSAAARPCCRWCKRIPVFWGGRLQNNSDRA